MTRKKIFGWAPFLLAGTMVLLHALSNPRLRVLRVPDALQLVAIGIFLGVGIALFSFRPERLKTDEKEL